MSRAESAVSWWPVVPLGAFRLGWVVDVTVVREVGVLMSTRACGMMCERGLEYKATNQRWRDASVFTRGHTPNSAVRSDVGRRKDGIDQQKG